MSEENHVNFMFTTLEKKSILMPFKGFEIYFESTMPNWWWRFWQFVLLGWQWRNLTKRLPNNSSGKV